MAFSLVDFLIGPQYPDVPPIVVGALGEVGLWLNDGDRAQAERELVATLPRHFQDVAERGGYQGCLTENDGDPVVVTCLFTVKPDATTGWPWPVFVLVVPVAGLAAYFKYLTEGRVIWYAKPDAAPHIGREHLPHRKGEA